MIGHRNSEAEESKIQIDTGLFVDLLLLRKSKNYDLEVKPVDVNSRA